MSAFSQPPSRSVDLKAYAFEVKIPDKAIDDLKILLDLSPLPPFTYEGSLADRTYGVTRNWLIETRDYWRHSFDWRKHEAHINSVPNFKLPIEDDDGRVYDIHFIALFSKKVDAVPLLVLHGWPGALHTSKTLQKRRGSFRYYTDIQSFVSLDRKLSGISSYLRCSKKSIYPRDTSLPHCLPIDAWLRVFNPATC